MKNKEYKVSEEVKMQYDKYAALFKLKDQYIELKILFNKHKLIKKLAIEAETAKRKFWEMVRDQHPDLNQKSITYLNSVITVNKDN